MNEQDDTAETTEATETPETEKPARPRRNSFSKSGPKLAPDAAARQGEVTTLAFKALGRDAAIAFLNAPNDELGSRPIDLAVESAEGAARVRALIEASRTAGG